MHQMTIYLLIVLVLVAEGRINVFIQHLGNKLPATFHNEATVADVRALIKKQYNPDFPFGIHHARHVSIGNLLENKAKLNEFGSRLFLNTVVWDVRHLRPYYELDQIERIVEFAEARTANLSQYSWFRVRKPGNLVWEFVARDESGMYLREYRPANGGTMDVDRYRQFVGYLDLSYDLEEHYNANQIGEIHNLAQNCGVGNIYFLIRALGAGDAEYEYVSRDEHGHYQSYRGREPEFLQRNYRFVGHYDLEIECCVCTDTTSVVYNEEGFDQRFGFCCPHASHNVCAVCWNALAKRGNGKVKCPMCRAHN